MRIKFTLSEFVITGTRIPLNIADKILKYHIDPMDEVRNELNIPIFPSEKSGYRTVKWEKAHGRSGNSQHIFKNKGAVDWTCSNFADNKDKLYKAIIKYTNYTRIAIYNSFIHCDYKETNSGKREQYKSDSSSKWTFVKYI